jgi:hypothetical protein
MNNISIKIRNKLVRVFSTKIILIEKNNQIISNNLLMLLSSLIYKINYQEILFIFKINYLYKIDNIYFYEDYTNNNIICPIILSAKITTYNEQTELDNKIDIINNISKYNLSVPLYIFIYNEKINNINNIEFKIFKSGKIIDIIINYNNNKYKKIYELIQ